MKKRKRLILFFLLVLCGFSSVHAQLDWLLSPDEGFNQCSRISDNYFLLKKGERQYLMNLDGKIIETDYDKILRLDYGDEYFKVQKGKLFGLYHPKEGEIIPPVYEKFELIEKKLIKVSRYNMFAVINYQNELIVPYRSNARMVGVGPNFIFAGFHNNLAIYNSDGEKIDLNNATGGKSIGKGLISLKFGKKTALADSDGNLLSEPIYDEIRDFRTQEVTWVKKEGKWGVIDSLGNEIISFNYDEPGFFHRGFAAPKKAGKAVLIDQKGNEKFGGKYDRMEIHKNKAKITVGRKQGCLDLSGGEFIPPIYFNIGKCHDDLIPAKKEPKELFGYVNTEGKQVIEPKFKRANPFSKDMALAIAGKRDSMGLINRKGDFVVRPDYYAIEWNKELELFRAKASRSAPYEYFTKNGQPFSTGHLGNDVQFYSRTGDIISYSNDKGHGYCDKNLKVIIEAQFNHIKGVKNGLAIVKKGEFSGVLREPNTD